MPIFLQGENRFLSVVVCTSCFLGLPSYLKHFVGRRLNTGNKVGWRESCLLHLCKVVCRIPVQHHLAHWDQRVLLVRPHLQVGMAWHEAGWVRNRNLAVFIK